MDDHGELRLDEFELYKLAREFRKEVYRLIKQLPAKERYCLDPQMRKAILSVTNNIAEGHGRWHYQENIGFCRISRGSIEEILDDINTCIEEEYGGVASNEKSNAHVSPAVVGKRRRGLRLQGLRPIVPVHPERRRRAPGGTPFAKGRLVAAKPCVSRAKTDRA